MLQSLAHLIRSERSVLAFGLTCAFLSAPGQTFFVAQYTSLISQDLGLSATGIGSVYLVATLAAAALLPLTGRLIDHMDIRWYVAAVAFALSVACIAVSVAIGPISLFLAICLLRLSGQGLMSHIALTATARYFELRRGRALSIVALGYPLAEAITPLAAATLILAVGWRVSYAFIALFVLVLSLPFLLWLIRDVRRFTDAPRGNAARGRTSSYAALKPVLTAPFFWLVLPLLIFLPFASTALIFHIYALAALRGWATDLVPLSFAFFAFGHAVGIIASGFLIDRLSAPTLLSYMNVPAFLSLTIYALADQSATLLLFMWLLGGSTGLAHTTATAMWAEVFGTANLGAVRSFAAMLMVTGTALGPAVLGALLDSGSSAVEIAAVLSLYGLVAMALSLVGRRRLGVA